MSYSLNFRERAVADVRAHPDAYLHERAARFNVSTQAIFYALRRLGVRKKNDEVCADKPD